MLWALRVNSSSTSLIAAVKDALMTGGQRILSHETHIFLKHTLNKFHTSNTVYIRKHSVK